MRTHSDIIREAGGASKFARRIGAVPNNVKAWLRNNSIPGPWWKAVSDARIATLPELAAAVACETDIPPHDDLPLPMPNTDVIGRIRIEFKLNSWPARPVAVSNG